VQLGKLDCSYSLVIMGKHSGEVSPIGSQGNHAKSVAWDITQSNECPELTGGVGIQGGCK